jgi:hypothetical protein
MHTLILILAAGSTPALPARTEGPAAAPSGWNGGQQSARAHERRPHLFGRRNHTPPPSPQPGCNCGQPGASPNYVEGMAPPPAMAVPGYQAFISQPTQWHEAAPGQGAYPGASSWTASSPAAVPFPTASAPVTAAPAVLTMPSESPTQPAKMAKPLPRGEPAGQDPF